MTAHNRDAVERVPETALDSRPLRILLVATAYPLLTTGRLRQVHIVRELGARHQVHVVSLAAPELAADPPQLEGAADVTAVVAPPPQGRSRRSRGWLARMRNQPTTELLALAAAANRAALAGPVDVMLVAGREIGPVLERLPRLPLVLDLCDSRSVRLRGQLDVAPLAARPGIAIRCLAERRYDGSLMARVDHVLVASDRDRLALDRRIPTPVTIIPNGVDAATWQRRTEHLGSAVAFSGAMDYPANADAAVHLANRVMPLVWRRRPDTRLLVVGRDPTPAVAALAANPLVSVTGTVDDVRPFLEEAGVYAAPLRFASGIQNKLLEAMAMAIPVVTTPIAAAGLETPTGDPPPLRIAIEPEDFAAGILAALEKRDVDPEPDWAGRDYVETRFGWRASVDRLEQTLLRVAEGTRA